MNLKITPETVKQLIALREECEASESMSPRPALEQFLDGLPEDQKYEVAALAMTVRGDYEDFESAIEVAKCEIKEPELTEHLADFPNLHYHLTDAVNLGWPYFEQPLVRDEEDDDGA